METISKQARRELIAAVRERYAVSSKPEKGAILNEVTAVSGFHRKHAIRLMTTRKPTETSAIGPGLRVYDAAVLHALTILWEASDRVCGKRLKSVIPQLIESMERHGHLRLEGQVRKKLMSASAATIDRLLKPVRKETVIRRRRRREKSASKQVPIKTFADWKDPEPGFFEMDFVVHGGGSMSGEYLHSLVVTDVCSGWVEAVPLLAREQSLVIEGVRRMRVQLPMKMKGIDSDNDSAFINDTVSDYCEAEGIEFTRSRVHHKNDQAWIEQKNGAVIRKIVGHERLTGLVAGQALAQLYQVVRLYVNFFQPSFKLRERVRVGPKIKKQYHPPATPCDRLLAHGAVSAEAKAALRTQRDGLDPVQLLHRVRQGQSALAALSAGATVDGPERENLKAFLASLPELWKAGEARPTHRKAPASPRHWRTREDPFKEVWADVLLWLQKEPDCTAKSLFGRLNEKYPNRFGGGQLRTLQRRIGEWRQVMARKLVLNGVEEQIDVEPVGGAPCPSGAVPLRLATLASATPPPKGKNPKPKA